MKKITSQILLLVVALVLLPSAPAHAGTNFPRTEAQKQAQKSWKKYQKQQAKIQKHQLREQNKQLKRWKKQHQTASVL